MAYNNLSDFVQKLRDAGELVEINEFVNPSLKVAELADRFSKAPDTQNKALLLTNNGTNYPILINALGSQKRICFALNCTDLDEHKQRIEDLFKTATSPKRTLKEKLSFLPLINELQSWIPKHTKSAQCQEVIEKDVDLTTIPILQCWKHDAGKFITFPMVITEHPETHCRNMGMYRMQVIDKQTTGMHWHPGKTGDNHYEAYKRLGKKMPVSVALGGDPANIFSATAPLPENIDEQMLTGFLRKKSVKLVTCITNNLEVPADADFVLEGYIDPNEDKFMEGPFGDHTGFYSLPDLYPKFHVTCITHRKQAIYPATIVGIPPMEDAWIGKATERIFLAPIKMLICPDLIDYVMPFEGVAHNLVVAKIKKTNEGQTAKVVNALWGAGQMANNKTLIIVDESCDIYSREAVISAIQDNVDPAEDVIIMKGPLDVLDHSGPHIGIGSKLAIDATKKTFNRKKNTIAFLPMESLPQQEILEKAKTYFHENKSTSFIITYDKSIQNIDANGMESKYTSEQFIALWHILNNYNPNKDCVLETFDNQSCMIINGCTKIKSEQLRDTPSPVTADEETIQTVDAFMSNGYTPLSSPSRQYRKLLHLDSAWRYKNAKE
ncbi:MAG: menaquinone biosynthesis decarboxylase [Bacteroidales bacterium]|nr:menaquinone biosynthesis decarboxylase [Bacteroidales bacterium]